MQTALATFGFAGGVKHSVSTNLHEVHLRCFKQRRSFMTTTFLREKRKINDKFRNVIFSFTKNTLPESEYDNQSLIPCVQAPVMYSYKMLRYRYSTLPISKKHAKGSKQNFVGDQWSQHRWRALASPETTFLMRCKLFYPVPPFLSKSLTSLFGKVVCRVWLFPLYYSQVKQSLPNIIFNQNPGFVERKSVKLAEISAKVCQHHLRYSSPNTRLVI